MQVMESLDVVVPCAGGPVATYAGVAIPGGVGTLGPWCCVECDCAGVRVWAVLVPVLPACCLDAVCGWACALSHGALLLWWVLGILAPEGQVS